MIHCRNNGKYNHHIRIFLSWGDSIYATYPWPYMPVTIMVSSVILSLLLPLLAPSFLNTNKELQQKLTIPSTTIKIPNSHLGTPLQATAHTGFWKAGEFFIFTEITCKIFICKPSFNLDKIQQPKSWSQEEHSRKVKEEPIGKLEKQLKKIAKEKTYNLQKIALPKNLSFWLRV